MIVFFDTVRRKRSEREGGELVKLDWETKQTLGTVPLFPFDPNVTHDPNPRGNSRGGKGIVALDGEILVATYHSILVFDHELQLKRKIDNPLFVGIHEMDLDGEHLWVSSTAIDLALKVDFWGSASEWWWPREIPELRERYGLEAMQVDKRADNRLLHLDTERSQVHHTHLNAVCVHGGAVYALLNSQGILFRIGPSPGVIVEDKLLKGAHSPRIIDGGRLLAVCGTKSRAVLFYELANGQLVKRVNLLALDPVRRLYEEHPDQPFNQSIFVRGLTMIDERRMLVGISPAALIELDWTSGELHGFHVHSDDDGDAVHGVAVLR